MRLASLSHWYKYIPCKENKFFASTKNCFKSWEIGEILIILIGREGVSVSKIIGEPYYSNLMYWDNDLYPWRIPIKIYYEFDGETGQKINRKIRKFLWNAYEDKYGVVLLNRQKISKKIEKQITELLAFNGLKI